MGSGFQDFINKYGGDDKITNKDIRDFGDSGGSQEKAEAYLKKIESQQDTKNKTAALKANRASRMTHSTASQSCVTIVRHSRA